MVVLSSSSAFFSPLWLSLPQLWRRRPRNTQGRSRRTRSQTFIMISVPNCNCSCLIYGDQWNSHEAIKQLNVASSVLISRKGRQCGGMLPNFNAKRRAICFRLGSLKELNHFVPHFGQSLSRGTSMGAINISCSLPSSFSRFSEHSNASSVLTDGREISKCCSWRKSAEPMLDGANNGFPSKLDKLLGVLDKDRGFSERDLPIEEPWVSLSSVHSNPTDGDTDASDLINRDTTVDAVESASLYSDTYQPVEEPWLLYPAAESVNADVGFNYEASTGEQSPNGKQNLITYQEHAVQFPEKRPDEELIKHLLSNISISIEILINSSLCSMQRIAVLEDGELVELLLEPVKDNVLCDSIYLGVVGKLLPQMGGAFVFIGNKHNCLMEIQHGKQPFIFPPFWSSKKKELTDKAPSSAVRDQFGAKQNEQRLSDDVEEPDDDSVAVFQDGSTSCINDEFADDEVDDIDVAEFTSKKLIQAEESITDLYVNGSCLKNEDSYSWDDIRPGTKIVVQVVKEGLGRKGPCVTPYPKLKSRFWILVTRGSNIGISKKITGTERTRLKGIAKKIAKALLPPGFGLKVRTVAEGHWEEELKKDLKGLLLTWKAIIKHAKSAALAADEGLENSVPVILHEAMGQTLSVVQDYFSHKVKRMVVDSPRIYHEVTSYLQDIAPDLCDRVELHSKKVPLFNEFKIEDEMNNLLNKRVPLPDGGSLVIEQTEGLFSIDVNGGLKMLGEGSTQEKAILDVNLAAAKQIARQLRLRDIGGIIVVDFIDMVDDANKRLVYEEVLKAVERDHSPVHVSELSKNGLMEITRKRVRPSLTFMISEECSCCQATGRVEALETSFWKIEHEIRRLLAEMGQKADPEKPMSWPKMLLRVDRYMCEYLTSGKKTRFATLCSSLKVLIILKVVRSFTRGAFELKPWTDDEGKNDKNIFDLWPRVRPTEA
ncbi:Ribonuclease E/G-like protein [Drosera capensis]